MKQKRKGMKIVNPTIWAKPFECPEWTEREKEIMAWSVEWEGSIGINVRGSGRSLAPMIQITNTDFDVIEHFHDIAKKIGNFHVHDYKDGRKPIKMLTIGALLQVECILKNVLPYMHKRKGKIAELVLEFIASRKRRGILKNPSIPVSNREWEIYKEVKQLNKRGLPEEKAI